jgi:endonuclease YncB( thermonuclease family)
MTASAPARGGLGKSPCVWDDARMRVTRRTGVGDGAGMHLRPARARIPFTAWLAALGVLAGAACTASAQPAANGVIQGVGRVIDGDTLEVSGARIRLRAVDAPERSQACTDARGQPHLAGEAARTALTAKIAGQTLRCTVGGNDVHGRTVASCAVGREDLGAWLVRSGLAFAYRSYGLDYVAAEDEARRARRGLWAGQCQPPWEWRRARRAGETRADEPPRASTPPRPDCLIKGNVSARGERIYHLPGTRPYANTRVDEARGERWFCNEAEARRAGFRPPRGG